MKLIWHIVKKDFVRDRWALLVWGLLFVGQVAFGAWCRAQPAFDRDDLVRLQSIGAGWVFLQMIMGYILVTRLVHADGLLGSTEFWLTRPISRLRLLAAKLLATLLIFALLPAVLLAPWWWYCSFGLPEVLLAAAETVGWQLLMIVPALLVASLADNLSRVLLWTLLMFVGLLSWLALLQGALGRLYGQEMGASGSAYARISVCAVLLVVGAIAIVSHQYLARRRVRSIVFTVLLLGAVATTGYVWPWNHTEAVANLHRPRLAPLDPSLAGQMNFHLMAATGSLGRRERRNEAAWLNVRLDVTGLPEGTGVAAWDSWQTWSWPGGLKVSRGTYFWPGSYVGHDVVRRAYALPTPQEDPETVEWHRTRRDRRNAGLAAQGQPLIQRSRPQPQGSGQSLTGSVSLPNSFLAKIHAEPPSYRGILNCLLYAPRVAADLPLKPKAAVAVGAKAFRVDEPGDGSSWIVATSPSIDEMGLWFSGLASPDIRKWMVRERILAVNHQTGDINQVHGYYVGSRFLRIAGVCMGWSHLGGLSRQVIRGGKEVPLDPAWREHTTLVVVDDNEIARFSRTIETARFESGLVPWTQ